MPINQMPADLPQLVDDNHGVFLPATAVDIDHSGGPDAIVHYDPWTHAQLAKQADTSQPEIGSYGEPSYAKGGSIVAEWGGMANPVRDYQDHDYAVLQVKRQVKDFSGVTGRFNGPQETAYAATYQDPSTDYWSVLIGG